MYLHACLQNSYSYTSLYLWGACWRCVQFLWKCVWLLVHDTLQNMGWVFSFPHTTCECSMCARERETEWVSEWIWYTYDLCGAILCSQQKQQKSLMLFCMYMQTAAIVPPSKVYLTLGHLQEVSASLDEGINLSKYTGFIQYPTLSRECVVDTTGVIVNLLPLLATLHAPLQHIHVHVYTTPATCTICICKNMGWVV